MRVRLIVGAVLIVVGTTFAWSLALADADDEAACKDQCQAQHEQCIEYCGDHPDPVECDADCTDERRDCVNDCRP